MELLFVTVIAAGLGGGLRYLVPGRDTYGSVLLAAAAVAVTAAVWVGLLWLGWTFDGTWIWVVSLAAGTLASLALALVLPRTRRNHDAAHYERLAGVK